mgnify:CR=1 FL=1
MQRFEINKNENKYSELLSPTFDYDVFIKGENLSHSHYQPNFSYVVANKQYIHVNISDEIFTFKSNLKNIALQIEEAKEILSYLPNWDDEGAKATDVQTFLKAVHFLYNYTCFIERNFDVVIRVPYVDILKDGSVYINWELDTVKFLIVFSKNNHPLAYFYGERIDKRGNKIPFKSAIELNGEVDEIIAQWMKTYLV